MQDIVDEWTRNSIQNCRMILDVPTPDRSASDLAPTNLSVAVGVNALSSCGGVSKQLMIVDGAAVITGELQRSAIWSEVPDTSVDLVLRVDGEDFINLRSVNDWSPALTDSKGVMQIDVMDCGKALDRDIRDIEP